MRLWPIAEAEKAALWPQYRTYTAALRPDRPPDQRDPYFDLYWQETATRHPYWFGTDAPLGFAFVRDLTEPELDLEISEFCVFPQARRSGVGSAALPLVFAQHPGRWEVSVLLSNAEGLAFWPRALLRARVRDLRHQEDDIARDYHFSV